MSKYLDMAGLTYFYNQLKNKFALKSAIGTPLKSSTAAGMTDTNKIYVYTGSETGYTAGHWYYYESGSWHDGGTYNSSAVETDKTLSTSGMPADGKITGDKLTDLKSNVNNVVGNQTQNLILTDDRTISETTDRGITYSISNGICRLNGTVTGAAFTNNIYYTYSATTPTKPAWLVDGKTYYVDTNKVGDDEAIIRIGIYDGDNTNYVFESGEPGTFTYHEPTNYRGIVIRYFVLGGNSVNCEFNVKIYDLIDIKSIASDINDVVLLLNNNEEYTIKYKWEQGGIGSDGVDFSTYNYIRTSMIDIHNVQTMIITASENMTFRMVTYDQNKNFLVRGENKNLSYIWKPRTVQAYYTKIVVGYQNTGSISPDAGVNLTIKAYGDDTLWSNIFDEKYINQKVPLQKIYGITIYPNNLVEPMACSDNAYIGWNNGNEISGDGYFCTGYIPVIPETIYKSNVGRNLAWYDSSKTYLTGEKGTNIQIGVTSPTNAYFIRFTVNKATDGISNPLDLYFTDINNYNDAISIAGIPLDKTAWCNGKKINWIGDSIVEGDDFDEEVCKTLGLVKTSEYGINGSTIALKEDGTNGRNALCERYTNMSDDADLIAVSCGTNDFEYAWSPIGTIDSTEKTTFYGALKTLCEGLINKYPNKVIFFTTPIKRAQPFADGAGGEYTADGVMTTPFSKNKYGKTLMDYADIIKEVCGYYSIPVLDMYRESLLNPHLSSQQNMFDNVYTHPNTTGQKIMARRVAGWLAQLGYTIDSPT